MNRVVSRSSDCRKPRIFGPFDDVPSVAGGGSPSKRATYPSGQNLTKESRVFGQLPPISPTDVGTGQILSTSKWAAARRMANDP